MIVVVVIKKVNDVILISVILDVILVKFVGVVVIKIEIIIKLLNKLIKFNKNLI